MGEEVLARTFFLNEHPIIILFDSGASHDFMSSTCAKKVKLSLVASGMPYVISTPGGRVDANQIDQKVPLEWSRYRCYLRDELDKAASGSLRHT
jgi:hypothetical protein